MSFFDNKEVHRTVLMTTECVENYIRTIPLWSCVTVTVYGGGGLGLMYNLLVHPDKLYSSPIDGLPEQVTRNQGQSKMFNHLSDDF
jgi:hypothetical protein